MDVLAVKGITKYYGKICALNNVSFSIPQGSVYGILGPNGSGKTTLLGIIMNILRQNSGTFELFGELPVSHVRRRIGTLLETPNFYHYLSGEKNLQIAAAIKQKGAGDIDKVLKMVNLDDRRQSKFSTYSLGMKQRLAIASCLLGDPEVLVFDEPTNGLDPVGISEIRELIISLAKQGKTIIMASHLLDEVEKVCSHVAILKYGNLLTAGKADEVLVNEDIVEISAKDLDQLEHLLNTFQGVSQVKRLEHVIQAVFPPGKADTEEVNRFCIDHGLLLNHLILKKKSLEALFLEITKN
ncbi:MAG: ABC transporter ATP-binding protein [Bacteroidetes bacterium]|nr:ABC transporter ATP-binding protein [Bacteroidota bacterium]